VAVRIIFRGLILFRFPQKGEVDEGKIVAQLINDPALTGATPKTTKPLAGDRRPHEHNHLPELQMLWGDGPPGQVVPISLDPGVRVEIELPQPKRISRAQSFIDHCPNLPDIIARADPRFDKRQDPRTELIRNVVTVDSGTIRVRHLVTWDEGGFPLGGEGQPTGVRPATHALLKFMGSNVWGHMASEWVIDAEKADEVWVKQLRDGQVIKKNHLTTSRFPNHRVPDDTIDILINNYEMQGDRPVPWGLDFQWLFEAAGYGEADLANLPDGEFETWAAFAEKYDPDLFRSDIEALLRGTSGRPFPYILPKGALPGLKTLPDPTPPPKPTPQTDELSRPVCSGGQIAPGS
jgi:hypothetical protein